jgi:hypothetical protein
MGIFTIPATSNVCEIVSSMEDKEIIFPTDVADWHDWSTCDIGAKIAAIPDVVSENYEYAVLDRSDNCVKRAAKPVAPATYDSNLLSPWTGYVRWAGNLSGGAYPDNHPELNMYLPEFTTDVYLFAGWTIARKDGNHHWYPKGPDQTAGPGFGTGYVALSNTQSMGVTPAGSYRERTFHRRIFVKATTAGLKLGIWHDSISGSGYVRMTAMAFKA